MKTAVVSLVLATALCAGCATDPKYLAEANTVFGTNPSCMSYVNSSTAGGFNHMANSIFGKVSISVSSNGTDSVCGFSHNGPADLNQTGVSWEQLEQMSLARCEQSRKFTQIKSPCRVFSRNHQVVWGKTLDDAQ